MNRLQIKWLCIVVLWLGAIVLFARNVQSLDAFRKALAEADTIVSFRSFLGQTKGRAESASKQAATFYQPIESVDFGLLFLEEELFWLCKKNALQHFEFTVDKPAAAAQQAQITLTVSGSLKELVALLATIEGEYPYLTVLGVENTAKSGGYRLRLTYYFRVATA